jgi:hypothetical protein
MDQDGDDAEAPRASKGVQQQQQQQQQMLQRMLSMEEKLTKTLEEMGKIQAVVVDFGNIAKELQRDVGKAVKELRHDEPCSSNKLRPLVIQGSLLGPQRANLGPAPEDIAL